MKLLNGGNCFLFNSFLFQLWLVSKIHATVSFEHAAFPQCRASCKELPKQAPVLLLHRIENASSVWAYSTLGNQKKRCKKEIWTAQQLKNTVWGVCTVQKVFFWVGERERDRKKERKKERKRCIHQQLLRTTQAFPPSSPRRENGENYFTQQRRNVFTRQRGSGSTQFFPTCGSCCIWAFAYRKFTSVLSTFLGWYAW